MLSEITQFLVIGSSLEFLFQDGLEESTAAIGVGAEDGTCPNSNIYQGVGDAFGGYGEDTGGDSTPSSSGDDHCILTTKQKTSTSGRDGQTRRTSRLLSIPNGGLTLELSNVGLDDENLNLVSAATLPVYCFAVCN